MGQVVHQISGSALGIVEAAIIESYGQLTLGRPFKVVLGSTDVVVFVHDEELPPRPREENDNWTRPAARALMGWIG
jgi:hypothetical protein